MEVNKKEFEVEVSGQTLKLAVVRPTNLQRRQGDREYARAVKEALSAGAILRKKVKTVLREQGLWGDEQENLEKRIRQRIDDNLRRLQRGGFTRQEGVRLAVSIRRDRRDLLELMTDSNRLDEVTAEGQGDNARFNYLVSVCTLYADSGKPYYQGIDDYDAREEDPVGVVAAGHLMHLLYGLEENFEARLPENVWLKKHGLAGEDLFLRDRQGNRVDEEGRRIDERGRFINEAGEYVDSQGRRVDEQGAPLEEWLGFTDEEPSGSPEVPHAEPADSPA